MGNPDLVIVVNNMAYIIKGTEWNDHNEAIQKAMKKYDDYMTEVDKSRIDPETNDFYESADKDWMPESVNSVKVYEIYS